MNLHNIARAAITTVNADIVGTLQRNTGYSTNDAGKREPSYDEFQGPIQVQAVVGKDLEHVNNLNLQGNLRIVYLYGNWYGVVRADVKGGDILQFTEWNDNVVHSWRVVSVMESWPDWSKVVVCLLQ